MALKGPIYWHPFLYNLATRALYGRNFKARYEAVARYVEKGWSVLDLCCGDCYLKRFLDKSIKYEGRDFNEAFIKRARSRNISASYCDLRKPLAESGDYDCVIMMSSLYHFMEEASRVIDDMKASALKRVIISEPVSSPVLSKNKILSFAAKALSGAGTQGLSEMSRFSEENLAALFRRHGATRIFLAGRDLVGIFEK